MQPASDFFGDLDNCRRVSRRRSYRFDRARHRVFAHRASRCRDRMRAGATQSPRLRRHAVPHCGQSSGSLCGGIEIELPLIGMLNLEDYKLTTARPDELDPVPERSCLLLSFSGNSRAKFSKMLRLAC